MVMTVTPTAAKISSALARAGSERAWVSIPMKSGPVDMLGCSIFTQGLADGENVILVGTGFQ